MSKLKYRQDDIWTRNLGNPYIVEKYMFITSYNGDDFGFKVEIFFW